MSRSIAHWTPRYFYDRIAQEVYFRTHPQTPWLTRHSAKLLSQLIQSQDIGFEWGSGRSTIWFAQNMKCLTSVEHDAAWYSTVQQMLVQSGLSNVKHELHQINSDSEDRMSSYVQSIVSYPNEFFDFVLVDGIQRHFCAMAGLDKLKPGGIMVVDNANWYLAVPHWVKAPASRTESQGPANEYWHEFEVRTEDWRRVWTSDGVTATLLYWKKCGK